MLGADPWRDAVALHRRLAYVPGDVSLWPNLSGGEVIDLLGRLRGGFDQSRRDELVERFKFDPTKPCRTYSTGNRQKVALIAAFVSDVELFILDEPTLGLDPLMEAVFRDCITEVKQAGKTVLLSSHILAEVEALCDRISIINEGTIVESGTLAELRHLTRISVSVETARPVTGLSELPGVYNIRVDGARSHFNVDAGAINRVMAAPHPVRRARAHECSAHARRSVLAPLRTPDRGQRAMKVGEFSGTGALIRLILRRDRLLLPIWIALPPFFVIVVAAAFVRLYPTAALQQMLAAQIVNSPGFVALLGPVSSSTIGGLTAWRSSIFAAVIVAGANALTVIRHTRADEETGRYELLGSDVMGRRAPLSASLVVTLGADLVIAALVTGGLVAFGLPVAGSVALGLSFAAIGWTFAGTRRRGGAAGRERRGREGHRRGNLRSVLPVARRWRCERAERAVLGCHGCRRSGGCTSSNHSLANAGGYLRSSSARSSC